MICVLLTVLNLIWYLEHRGGTARHQVFVRSWYGCFSVTTTSTGNLFIRKEDKITIECNSLLNSHISAGKKKPTGKLTGKQIKERWKKEKMHFYSATHSSLCLHTFGPVKVVVSSVYNWLDTPLYLANGNPSNKKTAINLVTISIVIDVECEPTQKSRSTPKLYLTKCE